MSLHVSHQAGIASSWEGRVGKAKPTRFPKFSDFKGSWESKISKGPTPKIFFYPTLRIQVCPNRKGITRLPRTFRLGRLPMGLEAAKIVPIRRGGGWMGFLGPIDIQRPVEIHWAGQFITTFPAGWSPQMVVIVRESPPQNGLKLG